MITLLTGQPGDGKTLYAIAAVMALSEKSGRPVYYSGIADLKLPWIEMADPEKWYECPPGAIIVIDEAQRIFRPRGNAAAVPRHVSELETHRHQGHDLYIITQQPLLCDANVRRLVGRHFHAKRRFGMQNSTVHEWSQVAERPDQVRKDSIRHEFAFPKALYGVYKSAEVHTHKVRIPMRFWFLIILPVVAVGFLYFAVQGLLGRFRPPPVAAPVASLGVGLAQRAAVVGAVLTVADYVGAYEPRVPGLAHTAARYDGASQVANVPFPAACISMRKSCRCYTDQATRLDVPLSVCLQIVERGYFMEFAVRSEARASVRTQSAALPEAESVPEKAAGLVVGTRYEGMQWDTPDKRAVVPLPREVARP